MKAIHYTAWVKDGLSFIKNAFPLIRSGKRRSGVLFVDQDVVEYLKNHGVDGVSYAQHIAEQSIELELEDDLLNRISSDDATLMRLAKSNDLQRARNNFAEMRAAYNWLIKVGIIPCIRTDYIRILATIDPKYKHSPDFVMVYSDSDVAFSGDFKIPDMPHPLRMAIVAQSRGQDKGILSFQSINKAVESIKSRYAEQGNDDLYFNNDLLILKYDTQFAIDYLIDSQARIISMSRIRLKQFGGNDISALLQLNVDAMMDYVMNLDSETMSALCMDEREKKHLLSDKHKAAKRLSNFFVRNCGYGVLLCALQEIFDGRYRSLCMRDHNVRNWYMDNMTLKGTEKEFRDFITDVTVDPYVVGAISRQNNRLWNDHASMPRGHLDTPNSDVEDESVDSQCVTDIENPRATLEHCLSYASDMVAGVTQ